jgi:subtilisin family serine protease
MDIRTGSTALEKFLAGALSAAVCAFSSAIPASNAVAGVRSDVLGQALALAIADDTTDRLIVTLRDPSGAALPARLRAVGAAMGVPLKHVRAMSGNAHVVRMSRRMGRAEAHAMTWKLAGDASVLRVEPDSRMYVQQLPNDPMFAEQWHYYESAGGINLPAAWDITTGSASIVIAVLDSGIRPHVELAGRLLPGYDFISDLGIGNDGNGRDADASDPGDYGCNNSDSSWHGTHVAGTLGAASNNSSGVSGVNWVSKLLPLRRLQFRHRRCAALGRRHGHSQCAEKHHAGAGRQPQHRRRQVWLSLLVPERHQRCDSARHRGGGRRRQ